MRRVGVAEVAFYGLQVGWEGWAALQRSGGAGEAKESSHRCGRFSSGLGSCVVVVESELEALAGNAASLNTRTLL